MPHVRAERTAGRLGDVWGRNDHRRPERDAHCRRAVVCPGPWIPENQGSIGGLRLREISVVIRQLRLSAAPTTGRPVSGSPPWCACLRPGLSSGAFRSLTVTSAASTDGWSASGHVPQDWAIRGRVRRLGRRIPRTGPTSVFTDTAVGQFALDATNVTSSILLSRELKSPGSVEGPNYVSDSRGRAGKR